MPRVELKIDDLIAQPREHDASEDEIATLAKDIKAVGLQHPIVVSDGVVVDGLKRIAALIKLKQEVIPAIVSTDLPELAEALEAQRVRTPSTTRLIQLTEALAPAKAAYVKARRAFAGKKRGKSGAFPKGTEPTTRMLVSRATGVPGGKIEVLTTLMRLAELDPVMRSKLAELRRGKGSIYGLQTWMSIRSRGELTLVPTASADEVRAIMERGLRSIATTIEAMSKFGDASVLTQSERKQLLDSIGGQRTSMLALAKRIRQGLIAEEEQQEEETGE